MTELSAEQLHSIFETAIRPKYDRLVTVSSRRPTFVLIGGQPGAGKTESVAAARLSVPDAIEVIGDDLRRFHPAFPELMRTDPLRMPDATQQAANAWVHKSLDYLCERNASVLMETTLRNPEAVQNTLGHFRSAGYEVELRVLAVPETLSRLGTVERYVGQVEREGAGRWAPAVVHDAAYERMPESITRAINGGLVDRVTVQQRDDVTLLDATVAKTDVHAAHNAMDALTGGRKIEAMTPGQASAWLRGVERAATFMVHEPQAVNDDIVRTIQKLGADAPTVAGAAHPDDAQRRQEAAARIDRLVAQTGEAEAARQPQTHILQLPGTKNRAPYRASFPRSAGAVIPSDTETGSKNSRLPTAVRGSDVGRD
ncbi:MAG: zeta toxin family protein [Rhodoglobus sp.]